MVGIDIYEFVEEEGRDKKKTTLYVNVASIYVVPQVHDNSH